MVAYDKRITLNIVLLVTTHDSRDTHSRKFLQQVWSAYIYAVQSWYVGRHA